MQVQLLSFMLIVAVEPESAWTRVMVQDFEKASSPPNVWVLISPTRMLRSI